MEANQLQSQPQSDSNGFVDNPNYNPSQTGAGMQFVDNPNYNAPPKSDEIQAAPEDSDTATQLAHGIAGTFEGLGEGVFGTVAGAADIGNKIAQKVTGHQIGDTSFLHKLAGDEDVDHGTAQNIGRAGETIAEFLMGDAALKGLSAADKLTQVAKAMKIIESNSSLARALQLGINVGKAGVELGPEERAAIQKSPILARLVSAGYDAIRAGTTQAGQTLVKTGGDVGEAAQQGAEMGLGAGALGVPLGIAGGALAKAGEAADTAGALRATAEQAPTGAEAGQQFTNLAEGALKPAIEQAEAAKAGAEQTIQQAGEDVGKLAANAPEHAAITAATQKAAQNAYKALGDEFEKGRNTLTEATKDQNIPYAASPLETAAKELANKGQGEAKPLDEAFNKTRPGSDNANAMIATLLDPYGEKELQDTIEKGTSTDKEGKTVLSNQAQDAQAQLDQIAKDKENKPITLDMQELLDRRKQLNEFLRKTGWATDEQRADRDIYHRLIQGVDDSIQQLVIKSGNPEAIETLGKMNKDYKTGITRFQNPDVKALLQGNTNDVAKRLMGGGTSVADINTVKDAIGKDAFQKLSDDSLKRLVADSVDNQTGEFGFKNFFQKWNRIPPQVRDTMFGEAVGRDVIDQAIAKVQGINAANTIPEAESTIKDTTQTMKQLLGNGDVSSLVKDPERVQQLSKLVGPDAMGELGKTILQNQVREASTGVTGAVGQVDTGKFLNFINSLKDSPETVHALFRPTQETAQAYDKLINDVQHVQSVKNAVKYGILAPAGIGAGVGVGGWFSHAIIGGLIASGADYFARDLLEKIANHPQTWRTIKALDKFSQGTAGKTAGTVARYGTGQTLGPAIYSGLSNVLGANNNTQ
jgi:hypothetical protein